MSIPMIVKKAFRPGGSNSPLLRPGSPFEASGQSLARTYRALGMAVDAPAPVAEEPAEPPKRAYQRKVIEAEPEKTADLPTSMEPPKRRYQRRDMTAKTED